MDASLRSRVYRFGLWCDRRLEQVVVRAALSVAIITSLLPIDAVEHTEVELAFWGLFLTEFVMRVFAVAATARSEPSEGLGAAVDASDRRGTTSKHGRAGAIALLVLDAVALVSFLPLPVGADGARWLRVVRLLRMVALVGYWAPLLRDLWSILSRRERLRQVLLMGVVVGGLSFAGALVLHHAHDEPFDADEDGDVDRTDRSFAVLLWWSFRQVQDPGNMLESPHAVSVVVVSLMLTVFGLLLISFLIGLGSDVVHELVEQSRMRPPGFTGHTVLVNITPSTRALLRELLAYYKKLFPSDARLGTRRWFDDLRRRGISGGRYIVVGRALDAPEFLRGLSRVVYRLRPTDEEELLARADLLGAKRVLLLADPADPTPDAETIRMLLTLVERVRARERRRDAPPLRRTRVVIAEIHDESNVTAARAALATAGRSFRGWVVPTEKLLGLFFAGVVRRPGLGELLGTLLTSRGHEIYTCFFDTPGMGFPVARVDGLGGTAGTVMTRLARAGAAAGGVRGPVIPIGVLLDRPSSVRDDFEVVLNPPADLELDASRVRGLVGLADEFGGVLRWIAALRGDVARTPAAATRGVLPELARTHRTKTTKVLVCGFRPGTIYLLEELFRSDPTGEVLVLVHEAAATRAAIEAIDAHTQLVRRGLLPGRHGTFDPSEPDGTPGGLARSGRFRASMVGAQAGVGKLHIETADWMASRHLVELPAGFGHVAELDAIVFVASDGDATDPRTTTALLKLEELCLARKDGGRPNVVAEVYDDALAVRLSARARELGQAHVQVYSSQELRAFFLFQSVVVPGFDRVYEELLGAWGQSLVHLDAIAPAPSGSRCDFAALAEMLQARGEILVALELADARGDTRIHVAPSADARTGGGVFELDRLRGAWVIAPDSGRLAPTERHDVAAVAGRAEICDPP